MIVDIRSIPLVKLYEIFFTFSSSELFKTGYRRESSFLRCSIMRVFNSSSNPERLAGLPVEDFIFEISLNRALCSSFNSSISCNYFLLVNLRGKYYFKGGKSRKPEKQFDFSPFFL